MHFFRFFLNIFPPRSGTGMNAVMRIHADLDLQPCLGALEACSPPQKMLLFLKLFYFLLKIFL